MILPLVPSSDDHVAEGEPVYIPQNLNTILAKTFSQPTGTNEFTLPKLRQDAGFPSLYKDNYFSRDRFNQPNVRLYYNQDEIATHRVVMENKSWRIQIQRSSEHGSFLLSNKEPSSMQIRHMMDMYQIWNHSPSALEYCVGLYQFEKASWDNLTFEFTDLAYYKDPNAKAIHTGGQQLKPKDLKRLGSVNNVLETWRDSMLNDDIINTITCDILQPTTSIALYLSTHYYTFIKRIFSLPNMSSADMSQLLRWGKKSGKESNQILKHQSTTVIIHLNGNHWYFISLRLDSFN